MALPRIVMGLSVALASGVLGLQAQEAATAGPTISAMGFGDVSYVATERRIGDGFLVGQVVGHLSAGVTDRLSVFGEVSATGRESGFTIEAERLIVRYDFTDAFKLSAGRYHTPISYWNTAYHHGTWLHTSVARPRVVAFGSQLTPVHFIGLLAEGNLGPPAVGFGYAAGVGNGRGSNIARAGDAGDVNPNRALLLALRARPSELRDLQFGGGIYADRVTPAVGERVDERIYSAHVAWTRERPELVAEYTRFDHRLSGSAMGTSVTDAFYVQLAYRLHGGAAGFKPYIRLEDTDVPASDPLFDPILHDYNARIAGVRYDFAPLAALKAEYRHEQFHSPERFHSLYLQVSFALAAVGGGAPRHAGQGRHPSGGLP
jgi:hypothetical protein